MKEFRKEIKRLSNVVDAIFIADGYEVLELDKKVPVWAFIWLKQLYYDKADLKLLEEAEEYLNELETRQIIEIILEENKLENQAQLN